MQRQRDQRCLKILRERDIISCCSDVVIHQKCSNMLESRLWTDKRKQRSVALAVRPNNEITSKSSTGACADGFQGDRCVISKDNLRPLQC